MYRWLAEVNGNGGAIAEASDKGHHGHGGCRVSGLKGGASSDHEGSSMKWRSASQWFKDEKDHFADMAPNPDSAGGSLYQIDKVFKEEYYGMYVISMVDQYKLGDDEIAGISCWKEVWKKDHPDLVMRVHKNVDSKDKVSNIYSECISLRVLPLKSCCDS